MSGKQLFQTITCEQTAQTLVIRLNRPEKRNALCDRMVDEILEVLEGLENNSVKLLVFLGSGKAFSAGFDLSNIDEESEGDIFRRFVRVELLLQAVFHAPCMTMAFAQGAVFGAGADLFCACRRRVAAPGVRFAMPGLKFGLVLGSRRFAHRVGIDVAQRLLCEGRVLELPEAFDIGLVSQVANAETWSDLICETERSLSQLTREAAGLPFFHNNPRHSSRRPPGSRAELSWSGLKERIGVYKSQLKAASNRKR